MIFMDFIKEENSIENRNNNQHKSNIGGVD